MSLQPLEELNQFYSTNDPWGYETNLSDKSRKAVLLSELEKLPRPKKVLDIGCGHGFITRDILGGSVTGVDISEPAIRQANKLSKRANCRYIVGNIFDLTKESLGEPEGYDLIIVTGVIYPQYVGHSLSVVYEKIDGLLRSGGLLVSVHIGEWYTALFPYILLRQITYDYREYQHTLEIYQKI